MIELRAAESDAGLEAWRAVRMAVCPHERCDTVSELRAQASADRLLLLAELDGRLAGSGICARSDTGGCFAQVRVLDAQRRHGVGTAVLRALADHAAGLGYEEIDAHLEESGSLGFAERFGFQEVDRQIEQVRSVCAREEEPCAPEGIEVLSLAGRPELVDRLFPELVSDAVADLAVDRPIRLTEEVWRTAWLPDGHDCFVALERGAIVGLAGYVLDPDRPGRAENALTAVRRDRRRRGIARALKQATILRASQRGLEQLYTWTQVRNEAMLTLNRSLGYLDRHVSITVRRGLPIEWSAAPGGW